VRLRKRKEIKIGRFHYGRTSLLGLPEDDDDDDVVRALCELCGARCLSVGGVCVTTCASSSLSSVLTLVASVRRGARGMSTAVRVDAAGPSSPSRLRTNASTSSNRHTHSQ
jgi:hypothetical protein